MIYRDPRAMGREEDVGSVVYLFSLPDLEEAKKLIEKGEALTLPARCWDPKKKRLRVYGRFIQEALKFPKATKDQLEKWKESALKNT